jgi:[ribosomal protein S18]-alanine N-acetyltransferase
MGGVLVLNYGGRTFTFTKEKLNEALQSVTRLVTETGGKFSWADAAKVHRLMHDIAWQDCDAHPLAEPRNYKVRITRWSTGTVITILERMQQEKFEAMRRLSWKYSQQYGCQWEIDVSVLECVNEAVKIERQMQGGCFAMTTKQSIDVHVRWMIRRDMEHVLAIENACTQYPWSEEDFVLFLRKTGNIGMTAEVKDEVVAFMVYELHINKLTLGNLGISPNHHRRGIGSAMIDKLKSKLSSDRRNTITVLVRESNLDAQMFFKSQGFVAVEVLRNHYDENGEDAYEMEYRFDE